MVSEKKGGKTGSRKRAVIFDFDGTIADSFDYVLSFLLREARSTTEYTENERQKLRQMSMHKLALHVGIPPWKLVGVFLRGRRYMRKHMQYVQPFKGMHGAIEELHTKGCLLFVASANSSHNVRLLLEREGLLNYFTAIQAGSGFMGKPRIIRRILQKNRLDPSTTWYIGDETGDIVSAAAAGVPSMAVSWGFADPKNLELVNPTAFVTNPGQITPALEQAWKT